MTECRDSRLPEAARLAARRVAFAGDRPATRVDVIMFGFGEFKGGLLCSRGCEGRIDDPWRAPNQSPRIWTPRSPLSDLEKPRLKGLLSQ